VIVHECSRSVHEYRWSIVGQTAEVPGHRRCHAHVARRLTGTVNFFCLWFRRYIKRGFNLLKCFSGN
jgi:hypothetical protein